MPIIYYIVQGHPGIKKYHNEKIHFEWNSVWCWFFFINLLCHTGWHFDQQAIKETPRIVWQGSEKFPGL